MLEISMQLRNHLADALAKNAKRLNRRPIDLLADLIERVLEDDLVDAVLDDDPRAMVE